MNTTTLLVPALATAMWLACWVVVFVRRRGRIAFAAASVFLAVLLLGIGPAEPEVVPVVAAALPDEETPSGRCADVKAGMSGDAVREVLGEPAAVVPEEDTFGPAAEAWVYTRSACVVRLLEGRVRSVDFESLQ